LPNSKRILSTIERLPSPRDGPVRKKPELELVSGSLDIEQKSLPATRTRRILAFWPWAWLALAGVVTVAWAIVLGGVAFAFVQWIVG
jgi:hypothetical protein